MRGEVLVDVICAMCGLPHDAYAQEDDDGQYHMSVDDLRCPSCDCPIAADVRPHESLA